MRVKSLLATALVLVLSILSTTFTFLALRSKRWSTQAYYFDNGTELGTTEIKPVCTLERSPFYRCGLPHVFMNQTCNITDCAYYSPYGKDKTSCRSSAEYGRPWSENVLSKGLLGMSMECQGVHYAGNLQIAAATFLTLGLLITLFLLLITVDATSPSKRASSTSTHHQSDHASKTAESSAASVGDQTEPTHHHGHSRHQESASARSPFAPYVVAVLLACLYAGALTQILAQYFGVLGLVVNATPTTDTAKGVVNDNDWNNFQADSWAIGEGLSTYATIAWTSALAGAAVATTVFRTPRFAKIL